MIVDRAEILTYLGLTNPSDTELAQVNLLHRSVERAVKRFVGYSIEQKTYIEYLPRGERYTFDQAGGLLDVVGGRTVEYSGEPSALQLTELPVRSITSIYQDASGFAGQRANAFAAGTLLTQGSHYYIDFDQDGLSKSGLVRRISGNWPAAPRSVKATYVAGYSIAELNGDPSASVDASDIKLAVLEAFSEAWDDKDRESLISSEHLADYSVSYAAGGGPTGIFKQRLSEYKNYGARLSL